MLKSRGRTLKGRGRMLKGRGRMLKSRGRTRGRMLQWPANKRTAVSSGAGMPPTIDLQPVVEHLRRQLGAQLRAIVLFGSRARGDARLDSDIDLLVVADGLPRDPTLSPHWTTSAPRRSRACLAGITQPRRAHPVRSRIQPHPALAGRLRRGHLPVRRRLLPTVADARASSARPVRLAASIGRGHAHVGLPARPSPELAP